MPSKIRSVSEFLPKCSVLSTTCYSVGKAMPAGDSQVNLKTGTSLAIGGSPINLVVLYYFFSMDSRTAAANSLYTALFSQITSLLSTLITKTVPEFELITLVLLVAGGILGGIIEWKISKKL